MTFEEILAFWEKDSFIDKSELATESLNIPKLHHKYYSIYISEKANLRKLEADFKVLKFEKYEFYTQGPNEDTKDKGWRMPAKGIILKADIPMYMESDAEIINLSLKVGIQQEKVDLLESIIKSFNTRGYIIKNAIDFTKFTMGGWIMMEQLSKTDSRLENSKNISVSLSTTKCMNINSYPLSTAIIKYSFDFCYSNVCMNS